MKKILMIGGTGTISMPITKLLAENEEYETYVLNRGHKALPSPKLKSLVGDINDTKRVKELIQNLSFDCVINFVLFNKEQAKENYELFKDKTKQFIFISTSVAVDHRYACNVDTSLVYGNRYSAYGRGKADAEKYFLDRYEENGFPITIVRPTQTYSEDRLPLSVKGKNYWGVIERMLAGKEVIVHGNGQVVWPSTHADDFARFFMSLVCNKEAIGDIFFIANPEPVTFDMIYKKIADKYGVEYKPVYMPVDWLADSKDYDLLSSIQGDKNYSCLFDISKIQKLNPGKEWEISIFDGIDRFYDYMEKHPERKVSDPDFDAWCDKVIASYKKAKEEFGKIDF